MRRAGVIVHFRRSNKYQWKAAVFHRRLFNSQQWIDDNNNYNNRAGTNEIGS